MPTVTGTGNLPARNGVSLATAGQGSKPRQPIAGALSRQRGLSRAEGVRQALRAWLDQQPLDHQVVYGLWRDRGGTSLAWERGLREEWNR